MSAPALEAFPRLAKFAFDRGGDFREAHRPFACQLECRLLPLIALAAERAFWPSTLCFPRALHSGCAPASRSSASSRRAAPENRADPHRPGKSHDGPIPRLMTWVPTILDFDA